MRYLLFAAMLGFTGCGLDLDLGNNPVKTPQEFSIDGLKVIAPEIKDTDDPSAMVQPTHVVASNRRVLMRLEGLMKHVDHVVLDDEKEATLVLRLAPGQGSRAARDTLELCPLTTNWSMHATWRAAHLSLPWNGEGGDWDVTGCVKARAVRAGEPEEQLSFDIKPWILNYARGRRQNFGHILISSVPVGIVGQQSGSESPRVRFTKWVKAKSE